MIVLASNPAAIGLIGKPTKDLAGATIVTHCPFTGEPLEVRPDYLIEWTPSPTGHDLEVLK